MKWAPACKDVSPEAKERPPLEDVIKQRSADREWEHEFLCEWSHKLCKSPIYRITNPNPVYSDSVTWQYHTRANKKAMRTCDMGTSLINTR
jgi:hypothetical protein